MLHGIWVLGSPTGDETCTAYVGSIESQPLDTREALCSLQFKLSRFYWGAIS